MCVRGRSLIDNKRRQFSFWDISSPVWGPVGNILRTLKVRQKALFRDRELVRCACEGFSLELPMFTLGLDGTVQVHFWTEHISNMRKNIYTWYANILHIRYVERNFPAAFPCLQPELCMDCIRICFYKWCTDDMDIFNYWPKPKSYK